MFTSKKLPRSAVSIDQNKRPKTLPRLKGGLPFKRVGGKKR